MVSANEKNTEKGVESLKIVLLTVNEASVWLKMSPSRVRFEVFRKRIPYFKIGRSIRFDEMDLVAWVLNKKQVVSNG